MIVCDKKSEQLASWIAVEDVYLRLPYEVHWRIDKDKTKIEQQTKKNSPLETIHNFLTTMV